ncbi:hypothetical protein HK099_006975 [Clydaea vesicula]|uniref:histidine kinase n=1 Tax=Clydaea vesicula TaxID=447962 RepID=A0AAD5U8S4_9FUNG|nr:hypothetical protein HK099_006975 [Clydaea vesicula]
MSCPFIPADNSPAKTFALEQSESLNKATELCSNKDLKQQALPNPVSSETSTATTTSLPTQPSTETASAAVVSPTYADEKERRLAEHVEKMDGNRHTSGGEGFKRTQKVINDNQQIEEQIFHGENEIFHKNEEAFFLAQDERELLNLKARQNEEIRALKVIQEQAIGDVNKRKAAKKFLRQQQREMKSLYNKTHEQEAACKKTEEAKQRLCEHRERCAKMADHIEEKHLKQIKQFNAAEERKINDQKILVELRVRHLTEEQRSEAMKEYQSKMNHQKALDKKKLDQICEQQRVELRHFKDKADLETLMMEEFANLLSTHELEEQEISNKHKLDYLLEKERIASTQLSLKVLLIQAENLIEIKKLQAVHRVQLRQLRRSQKSRKTKRYRHWSAILGRDLTQSKRTGSALQSGGGSSDQSADGSQGGSVASQSKPQSQAITRQSSDPNLKKSASPQINLVEGEEDEDDSQLKNINLDTQQENASDQLQKMKSQLMKLREIQEEKLEKLRKKNSNAQKEKEEEFQKMMMELEWQQDVDLKDLKKNDELEIQESIQIQERELEMEGHIRGAETKALLERKVLKSLLDSVADGVISIDPRGTIQRFNSSAEKMFGWSATQAINKNIKELMPPEFSINHDDYIYNYLTTGVKKVIGKVRQLKGLKKDGSIFPINVSVSEVVEDGFHLFTAIVRDLTEETNKEKLKQSEDDCLPQLIWKIDNSGKAMSLNKKFMEYTGLPEDQIYTVNLFSQAVIHPQDHKTALEAFMKGNKSKSAFEVKRRLKGADGTYKWFLSRGTPMFDLDGSILFWCGSCTDIDESECLQLQLSVLPESLPTILWKIDNEGNVLYSNSRFKEYTGHDFSKSIINLFSSEIIYTEDNEKVHSSFVNALKNKTFFEPTARLVSATGAFGWFLIRGTPVINSEGEVNGYFGTCTDVSAGHAKEDELHFFPESLPQLAWKCDTKGNTLYTNSKFRKFVGISDGQKFSVFSDALVHPDDLKPSKEKFIEANKEKANFEMKRRLQSENGEYKAYKTLAVPVFNERGEIISWYGTETAV